MKILWFSAGATSAVSCKLAIDKYGVDNVIIFYFKIKTAHLDNQRFIRDCEKWFNKKINVVSSDKYEDQFDVIEKTKYVNGPNGARCTSELKRFLREKIQKEIKFDGQVFGFEYVKKEIERSKRLPLDTKPLFPLIENKFDKSNCLAILENVGIEIPKMYQLGYPNNNCIGCVKGGIGYWNKIRIDFPEVFERMALLERKVNRSCLKDRNGLIFLDELSPARGRKLKIIIPDCGFFCGDNSEYI
jgi:hypothetical protein